MPHGVGAVMEVFHPVPGQKESDSVTERPFVLPS